MTDRVRRLIEEPRFDHEDGVDVSVNLTIVGCEEKACAAVNRDFSNEATGSGDLTKIVKSQLESVLDLSPDFPPVMGRVLGLI